MGGRGVSAANTYALHHTVQTTLLPVRVSGAAVRWDLRESTPLAPGRAAHPFVGKPKDPEVVNKLEDVLLLVEGRVESGLGGVAHIPRGGRGNRVGGTSQSWPLSGATSTVHVM